MLLYRFEACVSWSGRKHWQSIDWMQNKVKTDPPPMPSDQDPDSEKWHLQLQQNPKKKELQNFPKRTKKMRALPQENISAKMY